MWLWLALGWSALAVVVVWLHRRLRTLTPAYPSEVRTFVLQLESELARGHGDVQFLGMLPGRFACLLRVDGQETPVGLYEAFRHVEAFPDAVDKVVSRLLADVREVGLDRADALEFAAAAPLLLPQVRSREWLEEQGTFGDSGLVYTPINEQLVAVYVVDDSSCMVFVCRRHLERWRKRVSDVHNLALTNLARLSEERLEVGENDSVRLQSGDGFDASRLLLLDQQEGLLVAIPDRDTLWVGHDQGQSLERLMAVTEELAESSQHPVSGQVFRVTDGRLEPVTASRRR
ncbi:MAG: DUF1444 family protein [Planctomycetota bacterium]